jgi:FMN phosphatase YigB (HAD superfamily)
MKKQFFCILIFLSLGMIHQLSAVKKTIIISLDTMFYADEKKIEKRIRKKLGFGKKFGFLLSGAPSKPQIKEEFFSVLEQIPLANISIQDNAWQTSYVPWEEEYQYPLILNQSLISATYDDKKEIKQHIANELSTIRIKKKNKPIIQASIDFTLDTKLILDTMSTDQDMIEFLEELQERGHSIILIAGMSGYTWDTFLKSYSHADIIPELFSDDRIYVSGKKQLLPTAPLLFDMIIKDHKLKPKDTLAIGDHHNDLNYPREIGMQTLVYNPQKDNFSDFKEEIESLLAVPGAA